MITVDRAEGDEIKHSLSLEPSEDMTTRQEILFGLLLFSYLIFSHFIQHINKPQGKTGELVFSIFPDNQGLLFLQAENFNRKP